VTDTPRLAALRQELMKLVLINHALECPICDKGGECELQNLTHALAVPTVDLEAVKLPPNPDYVSRMVERHPDRCVTCGRCVRICRDHVGAMAINFMNRGYFTELGSGLIPLDCEFCGSCVDICPVGNEPMRDILDIRRSLVLMENNFPKQWETAFRGMERNVNPWAVPPTERMKWAEHHAWRTERGLQAGPAHF